MTMRLARIGGFLLLVILTWYVLAVQAFAHSWYSDREDPKYHLPCCGGEDCAPFPFIIGKNLFPTEEGFLVRLTVDEARTINPKADKPIEAVVEWTRVQESADGRWHICIAPTFRLAPHFGIYCFFAPPSI